MIVATAGVAEAQVTLPVRFAVLASEYVPVALNCWLAPAAIQGLAGVTAMLWRVAAVTVRVVLPLTAPSVALTRATCPMATPFASRSR